METGGAVGGEGPPSPILGLGRGEVAVRVESVAIFVCLQQYGVDLLMGAGGEGDGRWTD